MKKTLVFLAIGAISAIIGLLLYRSSWPFIQQVDLRLKDARFLARGAMPAPSNVVIVAVDEKSVKEIGRFPWHRSVVAELINSVNSYGARISAVDIVFSERETRGEDDAIASAIRSCGNVVLGYFWRADGHASSSSLAGIAGSRIQALKIDEGVTSVPIPQFSAADVTIPEIGRGAAGSGFFNFICDEDGLFRRAPLVAMCDGEIYPSLAAEAVLRYTRGSAFLDLGLFGVRTLRLGKRNVPVNESGELSLNFYGPGRTFRTFSATDVIHHRLKPGALKDSLVFIGVTEMGIYDIRAIPFDPVFPGVEISATAAANLLEGRYVTRNAYTAALELGLILFLPVLLSFYCARVKGTAWAAGGFAFLSATYLSLNFYLFSRQCLDLSIIFPLAPITLCYVGSEAFRNVILERKSKYLKRAFSSYVSPALVAELLKNPDSLKLGGEKKKITVLFSDIRGFTTLSETLQPEELVKLLNEYLNPMTRIVLAQNGMLDKYIGDAIMAIFNAPLDVDDHAARACETALQMLEEVEKLNAYLAARGTGPLEIGVGINTGEAIVGNMGADIRFDYTAIGDSVNLASRLEGLNKQYGTRTLVTASTRALAGEGYCFREIDLVCVKGKTEPVSLYELVRDQLPFQEDFAVALRMYRERRFEEALAIFLAIEGQSDPVSRVYVGRCQHYISQPPSVEWDGVFVSATK